MNDASDPTSEDQAKTDGLAAMAILALTIVFIVVVIVAII